MTPISGLCIEIDILTDIDLVWCLTQELASHQRWDLRFSKIDYLPRTNLACGQPERKKQPGPRQCLTKWVKKQERHTPS
jgi:hypothetical protein